MDMTLAVLAGLAPSVGVGALFWFAMRKVMRADRHEREALDRMDREAAAAAVEKAAQKSAQKAG